MKNITLDQKLFHFESKRFVALTLILDGSDSVQLSFDFAMGYHSVLDELRFINKETEIGHKMAFSFSFENQF